MAETIAFSRNVNILPEFADVEFFFLSLDSLFVELVAHEYHNFDLGGQSAVISRQLDVFLHRLERYNARYFVIHFESFYGAIKSEGVLNYLYSFFLAYVRHRIPATQIITLKDPLDPRLPQLLLQLTPSFILGTQLDVPERLVKDAKVAPYLKSIMDGFKRHRVLVFDLTNLSPSFTECRACTNPINASDETEEDAAKRWAAIADGLPAIEQVTNDYTDRHLFLVDVFKAEKKTESFETLCAATLLSSLICEKLGATRDYYEKLAPAGKTPSAEDRRHMLSLLTQRFLTVDATKIKFDLADIWDGRLITIIYNFVRGKRMLPFRLQELFGKLHTQANLTIPIAIDTDDKLLEPCDEPGVTVNPDALKYQIKNNPLQGYIQSQTDALKNIPTKPVVQETDYDALFGVVKWKFNSIVDLTIEAPAKNLTAWEQKKANRSRQQLSRWYQGFSDSLEGANNQLLVDFSRPVIKPASPTGNTKDGKTNNAGGKKGGGKKGGGKPGSKNATSKKDLILEANKDAQNKKQIRWDLDKIEYAIRLRNEGKLIETLQQLELHESKARCAYEIALLMFTNYASRAEKLYIEDKRFGAVDLVGRIKDCFNVYWQYLTTDQKTKVNEMWQQLGFEQPSAGKSINKELNLNINMVDFQLYYGGRLIDILTEPEPDYRVTGFKPDKWQRGMLDVVDQHESALIVAPTSAGKTFVSYYCIEKVLRESDDDLVIYVAPSKALINQVCGSIYARFRSKPMGPGRTLFGVLSMGYSDSVGACQVLVMTPESLEALLLSMDTTAQELVSKVKYVILDEVHCINVGEEGRFIEHVFLLIRCPFLALSATIGNQEAFHQWLIDVEASKTANLPTPRKVHLITYNERWSELELALSVLDTENVRDYAAEDTFVTEEDGEEGEEKPADSLAATVEKISLDDSPSETPGTLSPAPTPETPVKEENLVKYFMPYSIYRLDKIRVFGVPIDQLLTARQIFDLYTAIIKVDPELKTKFDPMNYFNLKPDGSEKVWLTRKHLRDYETQLKDQFVHWVHNDEEKAKKIFTAFDNSGIQGEFAKREVIDNKINVTLHNISPLIRQLYNNNMLPALCFNDDRDICEMLATRLFNDLEEREQEFIHSAEFKRKFNIKAEEKLEKIKKRKRDETDEKKKKRRINDEDGEAPAEMADEGDGLMVLRAKMQEALKRFRLTGKGNDMEFYDKTVERLRKGMRTDLTKTLLKLFERGIGFHHEAMSSPERACVEILFRAGFLTIVFSTSTLALGVNLPCKSVLFGVDTQELTPLQFRQMSGRAGRRGYDHSGSVIFISVPTSKIRRLLTASLPTLRGNVPFTLSFLLKTYSYINGSSEPPKAVVKTNKSKKTKEIDIADTTQRSVRIQAVMTLLEHSLTFHSLPEAEREPFRNLLKNFTLFGTQFLRNVNLLKADGNLSGFARIAVALNRYESGNLLFVYLLQRNHIRRFLEDLYDNEEAENEIYDKFVLLLAHLFTNLPVCVSGEERTTDSKLPLPVLPPLNDTFQGAIDDYNKLVNFYVYNTTVAASNGQIYEDNIKITGIVSPKEQFDFATDYLVSPVKQNFSLDQKMLPFADCQLTDYRKAPILYNSYAYDFWRNPSRQRLMKHNRLQVHEMWAFINSFYRLLETLTKVMKEVAPTTDIINRVLEPLTENYGIKFKTTFEMRK